VVDAQRRSGTSARWQEMARAQAAGQTRQGVELGKHRSSSRMPRVGGVHRGSGTVRACGRLDAARSGAHGRTIVGAELEDAHLGAQDAGLQSRKCERGANGAMTSRSGDLEER
jgi:hypothetical protein